MLQRLLSSIFCHFKKGPRSSTVRYMFPAVMLFAGVFGASVITSVEKSYVRLEVAEQTVEAGEIFQVKVYAYAHVPVNAVDITLRFDPEAVEVDGVDTGQSVITIWTEEPKVTTDSVVLRGGTYRKGFLEEHLIATIRLKGKKTGLSSFSAPNVVMLAGDGSGSSVPTAEAIGSKAGIFIYDENTDPSEIGVQIRIDVITDIDGDNKVTLKDVSMFMSAWHARDRIFDFNGDGKMTFIDFSIILADVFLK